MPIPATDSSGNLYIADFGAGEIDRISSTITASSVPSSFMAFHSRFAATPQGAVAFLGKPFDDNTLLDALHSALR